MSFPSKNDNLTTTNTISIFEAVKSGNLIQVQTIIEENGVECLRERDPEGHTAAHWACYRGFAHIVDHMIIVGGDVDIPTTTPPCQRPIHWACVYGNINVVDSLLNAGVNIDRTDDKVMSIPRSGCTPLIVAAQYGKSGLAAFLIGRGSQRQLVDIDGDTCLHWAAFKGHNELMRLLIYSGLSPHQKDRYGQAPIHLACISGCLTAVKELKEEEHVNINDADQNGKTPLILAQGRKHEDIIIYLTGALDKSKRFLPSFDFKSIVFGPPGNGKNAYWFMVLNFLLWGYPMYIFKCLPSTWHDMKFMHLCFMLVNALMWITLYKAKNSNPGFIARNSDAYHLTVKQVSFMKDTEEIELQLSSLCHTCRTVKPRRSKHCRTCNRCISNFDHHCPYIYNCVGYKNRVWFIIFVASVSLSMEITAYLAYHMLTTLGRDWLVVIGFMEACFFTVVANSIFIVTVYHALTNLTTNEHLNYRRYDYLKDGAGRFYNEYAQQGYLSNLAEYLHLKRQTLIDIPISIKVV